MVCSYVETSFAGHGARRVHRGHLSALKTGWFGSGFGFGFGFAGKEGGIAEAKGGEEEDRSELHDYSDLDGWKRSFLWDWKIDGERNGAMGKERKGEMRGFYLLEPTAVERSSCIEGD